MALGYRRAGRDGSKAALLDQALAGQVAGHVADVGCGLRGRPGPSDPPGHGRTNGLARPAGPPPRAGLGLPGGVPGTVRASHRLRPRHRHPARDRPGRAADRAAARPQCAGRPEGHPPGRAARPRPRRRYGPTETVPATGDARHGRSSDADRPARSALQRRRRGWRSATGVVDLW